MEANPIQPWNAFEPINDTLAGIVMGFKLEQLSNAFEPIDVTLPRIDMEAKLVHPWNV